VSLRSGADFGLAHHRDFPITGFEYKFWNLGVAEASKHIVLARSYADVCLEYSHWLAVSMMTPQKCGRCHDRIPACPMLNCVQLQSDASIFSLLAVYSTYLLVARVEIVGRQTHNGVGAAIDNWGQILHLLGMESYRVLGMVTVIRVLVVHGHRCSLDCMSIKDINTIAMQCIRVPNKWYLSYKMVPDSMLIDVIDDREQTLYHF
jgi:hypothetical protein